VWCVAASRKHPKTRVVQVLCVPLKWEFPETSEHRRLGDLQGKCQRVICRCTRSRCLLKLGVNESTVHRQTSLQYVVRDSGIPMGFPFKKSISCTRLLCRALPPVFVVYQVLYSHQASIPNQHYVLLCMLYGHAGTRDLTQGQRGSLFIILPRYFLRLTLRHRVVHMTLGGTELCMNTYIHVGSKGR